MDLSSILIRTVLVSEIRCFKISVLRAVAGQTCSIAVRPKDKNCDLKLDDLTKSKTILIDVDEVPKLRYEFRAELTLYSNESEIALNSHTEIYVYSETFKQCCTIASTRASGYPHLKLERLISKSKDKILEKIVEKRKKRSDSEYFINTDIFGHSNGQSITEILKSGEKNSINLRFKFKPQFVRIGQRIVIYTQKIKAVGVVTKVYD